MRLPTFIAEISLDAIIYIVLGLIWLVAQLTAAAAGRNRRRRLTETVAPTETDNGDRQAPTTAGGATEREQRAPPFQTVLDELWSGMPEPRAIASHRLDSRQPPPPPATNAFHPRPTVQKPWPAPKPAPGRSTAPSEANVPDALPRFDLQVGGQSLRALVMIPYPSLPMSAGTMAGFRGSKPGNRRKTLLRRLQGGNTRQDAVLFKAFLDPPRALTPPGGASWWDPRRG